jgi:twitching motility protein PilI
MMSGHNSMKAYQLELSERLKNATANSSATVLGVTVGNDRWLVQMNEVGEVVPLSKLTPVALTKSLFLGVANVRGDLYGITDLAAFFTGDATPRSLKARILLASPQFGVNSGLLVSNMLGIRCLADFESIETVDNEKPLGIAGKYKDKEGRLWRELNLRELVQDKKFMQIAV